jgi:hypothetical protein
LVRTDFAGYAATVSVDGVGAAAWRRNSGGWKGRFGGANIGALCVHVSESGGLRVGSVVRDLFGGELGPGVKETGVDSVGPGCEDGGK